MAVAERKDPFRGFNFRVEINNVPVAGFRECGGLSFTTDAVEYREGNEGHLHPRKLMGMRKFANITLKRGYTDNQELWKWYKNILDGKPDRHNGAVILQDELSTDVVRWQFLNGWICKYEGPAMNATNNEVAIETIEICVEQVVIA
jgi:phage tail-like protein